MKPGARLINAARGDVVDLEALVEALRSGTLAGAAIDVFPEEPTTESPLFGLPGVVVTPHLGASTVEAQDRAGVAVAEQVAAALTGGVVTGAVNIPAVAEALEVIGAYLPLARQLGPPGRDRRRRRLAAARSPTRASRRAGHPHPHVGRPHGVLSGHVEEAVNLVNAGASPPSAASSGRRRRRRGPATTPTGSPCAARGEPRRNDGGNHLSPAPGVGVRPGHRDRARAPHGDLPLPRRPREDRARRDDPRQGADQHRLDGRVPLAGRRPRGDGRVPRLAGAGGRRGRDRGHRGLRAGLVRHARRLPERGYLPATAPPPSASWPPHGGEPRGLLPAALRPGMRLPRLRLGPGTITEGLAAAVAPGPTVGLDAIRARCGAGRRPRDPRGRRSPRGRDRPALPETRRSTRFTRTPSSSTCGAPRMRSPRCAGSSTPAA